MSSYSITTYQTPVFKRLYPTHAKGQKKMIQSKTNRQCLYANLFEMIYADVMSAKIFSMNTKSDF